ncbi:phage tail protein [Streptomyces sp. NBC_01244]|uniref:phage tail protein n=1 Tax=Streptomyces sp. NBC_01244 TaxID=2903797 RepID=UPI002E157183|nr:phage tail protein [Streptomyces sp. NBC_01244]
MTAAEVDARAQALDVLRSRLPAHLLARDTESDGFVGRLLHAVAGELALLEADLEDLYDAWFVETCDDWVLPYLADLVGLDDLPSGLGLPAGPRALVANTVAHRRRKGTVGVLEEVAQDVTGWSARAVEFYQLLVATAHTNHVRTDRPATACVRDASRAELCGLDLVGAHSLTPGLDPFAHTAEVRRITSGRGRYGIPAVGVFLHPLQVAEIGRPDGKAGTGTEGGWSQARRRADEEGGGWTFDPLGRLSPLFAPRTSRDRDDGHAARTGEADLPVPLRPRRLLRLLEAARTGGADPEVLPLGVRIGTTATALGPKAIRVRGLEGLDPAEPRQVVVDPVDGTLRCYRGCQADDTEDVFVRYAYGALADVGAGGHDRSGAHEAALAVTDCRPGGGLEDRIVGASSVGSGAAGPGHPAATVGEALTRARTVLEAHADRPGAGYVLSITDSATYPEPTMDVELLSRTRLVAVAAQWPQRGSLDGSELPPGDGYVADGVRPHLLGTLTFTGGEGSSVVLDGLAIEGDIVVAPGELGALTISHCTLTGRLRVEGGAGDNGELRISVLRSTLGGIELGAPVPLLCASDSAIDGDVTGAETHASFEGCTVRGDTAVRTVDASSCLLDGRVTVADRQTGCVRFSYTGPGSHTPRRHQCVPAEAHGAASAPVYASVQPGSPLYLALARGCHEAIRAGAEHGAEMGVHHHLRRPLRLSAVERGLAPYLPVQLDLGICGS